ncbi:MGMT family protein [Patescibacteria group bacterium]|nr:MGMT family protein [Patescibacteria group bacterium]
MEKETAFRGEVYKAARRIPKGKVTTYGELARLAGRPGAARAVGFFMKTNPYAPKVPCHRVVASTGALTGYSARGGLKRKRALLVREGVKFEGGRVDMGTSLWKGNGN